LRRPRPDVLVVGAGVIGLTTGICLAEAGLRVVIRTCRRPQDTTSAVAGAVWGPHLVEESARAAHWAELTLAVLREQARDPATGVRVGSGILASRDPAAMAAAPEWAAALDGLRPARPGELPPGFTVGWRYSAPLVSMPVYLEYLAGRLTAAGGELTRFTGAAKPVSDAGASPSPAPPPGVFAV